MGRQFPVTGFETGRVDVRQTVEPVSHAPLLLFTPPRARARPYGADGSQGIDKGVEGSEFESIRGALMIPRLTWTRPQRDMCETSLQEWPVH